MQRLVFVALLLFVFVGVKARRSLDAPAAGNAWADGRTQSLPLPVPTACAAVGIWIGPMEEPSAIVPGSDETLIMATDRMTLWLTTLLAVRDDASFFAMRWQFLVFILTLVFVAGQSEAFGQRLTEGTKPVKADLAGFDEGYCSSVPARMRICKVVVSDSGDAKFIIQVNNKTIRSVEAHWYLADSPGNAFATYRSDLDKDGVPELILVSFDGVSNGMGISYSTVYIFQDPKRFPNADPASIPIKEFAGKESLFFDRRLHRMLLLATDWRGYETLDKKRGWGMYLVGKWFVYQKGKLKPLLDRPTLARRFLNRFANERDNDGFADRHPYRWLQDRTTHRFFREPISGTMPDSTRLGVVSNFSITPGEDCEIEIRTKEGEMVKGTCAGGRFAARKQNISASIANIGIWKYRYCFPYDFDPSFYLGNLTGKRVKLENRTDKYGNKYSDLWFVD